MNLKENMDSRLTRMKKSIFALKPQQWLVLLLIGILLVILSMPTSERMRSGQSTKSKASLWNSSDTFKAISDQESEASGSVSYRKNELEEKLEQVLSTAFGVGKVRVLIMTSEKKTDYFAESTTNVTGVLIVAEGADNPVTVQNIKEAVQALFQIEAHKIKIMKMK